MTARIQPSIDLLDGCQLREQTWVRGRNIIAAVALAAWAACAVGFAAHSRRFYVSYLVSFLFFLTIALGGLFFVMVQHLAGAVWSVPLRRVAENVMTTVSATAALFLPVILGMHSLYEWTHAPAGGKQSWLNEPFFIARAAVYFLVWSIISHRLYRASETPRAAVRWSAAGLLLLTITASLAAFDWIMSLEPHWYSTIFGVYVYSGAGLSFIAALTVILLAFRRGGLLRRLVHREHYHDLAKWLFGLTIFWAYIAFSQYLLIWYANLPEETTFFRDRVRGEWGRLGMLLALGGFLAPFFALLSRGAKRRLGFLAAVSAWMLLMHYADLYWLIMPAFFKQPQPHWLDAATFAAAGSVFTLAFWHKLRHAPLAPLGDARFEQALELRNV